MGAETFSSHDVFDQMTYSGKVFSIFCARKSALQQIFTTAVEVIPF